MKTGASPRHGLGDPRIPWVVLLDLNLPAGPPATEVVADRLTALADEAGWPPISAGAVRTGARRDLLGALAADGSEILRAGLHQDGLVLAARHDALDGLAMLTAAGRLLGEDVRSTARGVDSARLGAGSTGALLRRAWEVGIRPPARVAGSTSPPRPGDAFAAITIDGAPRTADLVHAGARAVVGWNHQHGSATKRVSVAVGVSTVGGTSSTLSDRSAFLRLTGVERRSVESIRDELATAPLQPGGGGSARPILATVSGLALRLAAPRLGSTLLVSHLGTIDSDIPAPAFYPVTGGGSGLSLGAATTRGRTTITVRARGSQHHDEHLERLLALVVDALEPSQA